MVAAPKRAGCAVATSGFNPCKGFGVVAARSPGAAISSSACFNPCKGFGVVAAMKQNTCLMKSLSFNPCKGFGVVAAWIDAKVLGDLLVSIPVRVLGWLQRLD